MITRCVYEAVTIAGRQRITWNFRLVPAQRYGVDAPDRTVVSSVLAGLVSRHCRHGSEWWTLG